MKREIGQRIERAATPEEQTRHDRIRKEIEVETPELIQWAKSAAANHRDRVNVGTVFTADEVEIVKAIDNYAVTHSLADRGDVVRQALANLLGVEVAVRR